MQNLSKLFASAGREIRCGQQIITNPFNLLHPFEVNVQKKDTLKRDFRLTNYQLKSSLFQSFVHT